MGIDFSPFSFQAVFNTFVAMKADHLTLCPREMETRDLHGYLLSAVGPRPIALASTVDAKGNPNLAPFSFFNVFSANPPVLIFSPARRVRNNTTKHTLENVLQTMEVVINVVTYDMVQQMSLASTEYDRDINEFDKAGFTMLASQDVRPYRVGESPVHFECRVTKVEPLGQEGGAGNLIFSEVVRMHIDQNILNEDNRIDPLQLDLVGRMGGSWYNRSAPGLFEVPKPLASKGVGVDAIPEVIRLSGVLTGNDLGMLGNIQQIPTEAEVRAFIAEEAEVHSLLASGDLMGIQEKARTYLKEHNAEAAWKLLLAPGLE